MRETMELNKEKEKTFIEVESNLEKPDGSREIFKINLLPDGKPKLIAFCDIDKTFVHLEPCYKEIRKTLWPKAVDKEGLEEVTRVHLAGFRLGTMWRELDRMHRIYELGQEQYKDSDVYSREILGSGKEGEYIDQPGNSLYEQANKMLETFDNVAAEVVEKMYQADADSFNEGKIGPIYHLAAMYKRLGVPMMAMSANPKKFLNAVLKYTGLSEHFIDSASDTDVPGLKEYKMEYLMETLKNKGLNIPYDRLIILGDSPTGDVGSGPRFEKLMKAKNPDLQVTVKGLLVVENNNDLQSARQVVSQDQDLIKSVQILDLSSVPVSKIDGSYLLAGKNQKDFLKEV
ncbi:hypothetical protein KKC17_02745 [Patescibacteria group bacterium]|nr:hypothetical protein [Patescibacteria group bacterium]